METTGSSTNDTDDQLFSTTNSATNSSIQTNSYCKVTRYTLSKRPSYKPHYASNSPVCLMSVFPVAYGLPDA